MQTVLLNLLYATQMVNAIAEIISLVPILTENVLKVCNNIKHEFISNMFPSFLGTLQVTNVCYSSDWCRVYGPYSYCDAKPKGACKCLDKAPMNDAKYCTLDKDADISSNKTKIDVF